MTYYLLLSGDSEKDSIYETNVLGEESFETFYPSIGFMILNRIINQKPELLESLQIVDEQKKQYTITKFLDKLESFFEKGGEFGFTIFLGNEYTLSKDPHFYYRVKENTYHFVRTTIEQYETYCEKNNLQFTLLPYSYKIDHKIEDIEHQNFCNIRRKK